MLKQARRLLRLMFGVTLPVDRKTYAKVGVTLMVVKFAGDALILHGATGYWWPPLSYLHFSDFAFRIPSPATWALTAWSLPFAWIGLSMTVRRLLHARRTPALALLFCVPVINLAAMVAFCFLPPPRGGEKRTLSAIWHQPSTLGAIFAAMAVTFLAVPMAVVGLQQLGWFLFAGAPLAIGFSTGLVAYRPGQAGATLGAAVVAMGFALGLIILLAVDGLICLVMALPIAVPLGLLGATVAYALRQAFQPRQAAVSLLIAFLALPFLAWVDADGKHPAPRLHTVTTEMRVPAPPEAVWPHLIAFDPLSPPRRAAFHLGIAYPTGARIEGRGIGAVRHCEFSTGVFVEPITVWQEPHHLAFDVAEQPAPLSELTPYRHLAIDHQQHGIHTRRGEFRLLPDGAGGTILRGTTWYEIQVSPEGYWELWTEPIIASIHRRVLEHIAARATREPSPPPPVPRRGSGGPL